MYAFLKRLDNRDLLLFAKMAEVIMGMVQERSMKPADALWLSQMEELALAEIARRGMGEALDRTQLGIMTDLAHPALIEDEPETAFDSFVNTLDFGPLDSDEDES